MGSGREWRVQQGGLWSAPKVHYSPETQALLKELLRESKLTMTQRKSVSESVKRGEPLPLPPRTRVAAPTPEPESDVILKPCPRRRSYKSILESGAYEASPSPPQSAKLDYFKEKMRLQRIMAYGKNTPEEKTKPKIKDENDTLSMSRKELFQHLMDEIKDREEFLRDMEKIGQGKTYRSQIKFEIAEKVKLMEEWDKKLFKDLEETNSDAPLDPASS